jgi:hypothetical protein
VNFSSKGGAGACHVSKMQLFGKKTITKHINIPNYIKINILIQNIRHNSICVKFSDQSDMARLCYTPKPDAIRSIAKF